MSRLFLASAIIAWRAQARFGAPRVRRSQEWEPSRGYGPGQADAGAGVNNFAAVQRRCRGRTVVWQPTRIPPRATSRLKLDRLVIASKSPPAAALRRFADLSEEAGNPTPLSMPGSSLTGWTLQSLSGSRLASTRHAFWPHLIPKPLEMSSFSTAFSIQRWVRSPGAPSSRKQRSEHRLRRPARPPALPQGVDGESRDLRARRGADPGSGRRAQHHRSMRLLAPPRRARHPDRCHGRVHELGISADRSCYVVRNP